MFVLRKISSDGVQLNFSLGESYTLVTEETNPKEFERSSLAFWKEAKPENTYGFVSDQQGRLFPLFKNQWNYIMTSNGKTFANVTLK